jgi:pimeloyl-ACP methyl ester carboxylesterase
MRHEINEVQLACGRVRFVVEGNGPALLLLHGLGGNWQSWLANIGPLALQHRVVAMDLPGFGCSETLAGPVTMEHLADPVVELMDALAIETATLVGNSMGGLLTIEAAVRHPHRVERAVLVCSGGMPLTAWRYRAVILPLFSGLNRALRVARLRRALLRNPRAREALAAWIVHDPHGVDPQRLVAALDGLGARGFGATLRGGRAYDARARAHKVGCPTLILWGRRDRLLPPSMGVQLHELIPGSKLFVWEDSGHCPMIEHPDRFDDLLSGFISGRSAVKALTSDG